MATSGTRASGLPPILPAPVSVTRDAGSLSLVDGMPIAIVADGPGSGPVSAGALCSARALQAEVYRRTGISLCIERHTGTERLGPHIALRSGRKLPSSAAAKCLGNAESYRLCVTNACAEIVAPADVGVRWAVETLLQLVDPRGRIPCCTIDDAPDFPMRGVMLDVSRGKVPTAETLRDLVDVCAKLKLNVLMLYTEHTFRFRRHPEIGAEDSPLDAETMLMLDAYALERHVELIPSLQSLGHMEDILKLPAYAHLAETDTRWSVAPSEPETYKLLADLYDEYLPNFRSGFMNANCDEPWDLGQGRSAARADQVGAGRLYLGHVDRLHEMAAAHHKRAMIWGDVVHQHPDCIPEIDRDLVLLDWWYEADFDYDRVKVFRENGLDFLVCPGTSSWNCLFPRIANSQKNIERWTEAGRRHGAMGVLNTDWGDFGHYNLQGNSWFGYAMGAQQAWSGTVPDGEFDRSFSRLLFDDPRGEVARIYRALGAIHDPGFRMFNGSPLQYLYFDEVERGYFVGATKPGALARCERALERVRARIDAAEHCFGPRGLTFQELCYAAEASLFAVRKARAGQAYIAWRRKPGSLKAAGRRKLAGELSELAREQSKLGRTLRRLWLARSAESNLQRTLGRIRRAQRSLAHAARCLERDRPTEPPPETRGISPRGALRAIRESIEG